MLDEQPGLFDQIEVIESDGGPKAAASQHDQPSEGSREGEPLDPETAAGVYAAIRDDLPRAVHGDIANAILETIFTDDPRCVDSAYRRLLTLHEVSGAPNP